MMFRVVFGISTLVMLLVMLTGPVYCQNDKVSIVAGVLPPLHYPNDTGVNDGFSIELLQLLMENLGHPVDRDAVTFMPWARALDTAKKQEQTILLGAARTEDRESLFCWMGPIVELQLGLIAAKDANIRPASPADLHKLRIGVVRNSAGAYLLEHVYGFTDDELTPVNSEDSQLHMLQNGRVDAISHTDITTPFAMRKLGLNPELYEMIHVLRKLPLYFALHPSLCGEEQLLGERLRAEFIAYAKQDNGRLLEALLQKHVTGERMRIVE